MKTIWKYELLIMDHQLVEMPQDAKILAVQVQRDVPCLWAMVDDETHLLESRIVRIIGTGHRYEDVGDYVGTFQMHGGELVFHVFIERAGS